MRLHGSLRIYLPGKEWRVEKVIDEWSDRMIDDHYGRNYYGPGRHYFDGPPEDRDEADEWDFWDTEADEDE